MAEVMTQRTPAQNRQMRGLLAEVQKRSGLNDDDTTAVLRRLCREASGQESSSRLSMAQAERVIAALNREAGRRPAAQTASPKAKQAPGDPVTPEQQRYITGLYRLLGWDQARASAFTRRQIMLPWAQTRAHVDKLVHPLEAMIKRQVDVDAVRARLAVLAALDLSADSWKAGWVADVSGRVAEADDVRAVLTPGRLVKLDEIEEWARGCGLLSAPEETTYHVK